MMTGYFSWNELSHIFISQLPERSLFVLLEAWSIHHGHCSFGTHHHWIIDILEYKSQFPFCSCNHWWSLWQLCQNHTALWCGHSFFQWHLSGLDHMMPGDENPCYSSLVSCLWTLNVRFIQGGPSWNICTQHLWIWKQNIDITLHKLCKNWYACTYLQILWGCISCILLTLLTTVLFLFALTILTLLAAPLISMACNNAIEDLSLSHSKGKNCFSQEMFGVLKSWTAHSRSFYNIV